MKYNREKFEEEIQQVLTKFELPTQTRRQIFSQVQYIIIHMMNHADEQRQRYLKAQQTTEKAIPNDKTSESSESDA